MTRLSAGAPSPSLPGRRGPGGTCNSLALAATWQESERVLRWLDYSSASEPARGFSVLALTRGPAPG
jgi:hypothetical protein